jgi:CRISPR/Cas system-associated exonuclease Cas4 (RecB family)
MKKPSLEKMKGLKTKETVSLMKKIDIYLKKISNPKHYAGAPRVKPSDLGSPCMRKIFYSYLRTEPDQRIMPKQKRIFDTGDAFHDMLKSWTKGVGCLIEYTDPKTGKLPINKWSGKEDGEFPIVVEELSIKQGKIDAILKLDGKLWIGEFKSIKDEKFHELKGAQEEHKIQANTYVHLFEFCLNRGDYKHIKELDGFTEVEGVIFIYLNKNDSEPKEYVVLKDDEHLEKIVEKISVLKKYVEDKELPPKTDHYCYFCPFNKKCKKEFNPLDSDDSE